MDEARGIRLLSLWHNEMLSGVLGRAISQREYPRLQVLAIEKSQVHGEVGYLVDELTGATCRHQGLGDSAA